MPDQHRRRTAFVIVGLPGSGISVVSAMIATMVDPSARYQPPSASSELSKLSDRILASLGLKSSDVKLPFVRGFGIEASQAAVQRKIELAFMEEAVALLTRQFSGQEDVVLDEPALGLLLGFWHAAFNQAGLACKYILAFRSPLELARSLRERAQIGGTKVQQLWTRYNLAVLGAETRQQGITPVSFEQLFDDPAATAAALAARLGMGIIPQTTLHRVVGCIDQVRRTSTVPNRTMAASPLVPELVKSFYRLIEAWTELADEERQQQLSVVAKAFNEFALLAGAFIPVEVEKTTVESVEAPATTPQNKRTRHVLLHYHLFKNAGTSFDAVLERSFQAGWVPQEFLPPVQGDQQLALNALVMSDPAIVAVSSHTLLLPVPELDGVSFFPVIFIRQPLARLRSAYEFERKQDADTLGANLAKQMSFGDYLQTRLENPHDRSCRDFQTFRLAMALPRSVGPERNRALAALDLLPFVGLVENFAESMQLLEQLLATDFPAFKGFAVKKNVTGSHGNREDGMAIIRRELGDAVYDQVMEANQGDLALFERVQQRYA